MERDLSTLGEKLVKIRRRIHRHPELAYQEYETSRLVADYLADLGYHVRTQVTGTGVVAERTGTAGKPVILTADMDALPLQDEKKVDYASKVPGVMPAATMGMWRPSLGRPPCLPGRTYRSGLYSGRLKRVPEMIPSAVRARRGFLRKERSVAAGRSSDSTWTAQGAAGNFLFPKDRYSAQSTGSKLA